MGLSCDVARPVGEGARADADTKVAVAGVEVFTLIFVFKLAVTGEGSIENLLISNVLADVSTTSGVDPPEELSKLPGLPVSLEDGLLVALLASVALLRLINWIQAPFFPSALLFFSHGESPTDSCFLERFFRLIHHNMMNAMNPIPRITDITVIPIVDPDIVPASLSL